MPYLRLEDGDLYYHCQGEGAPVVFVNDWVLSQHYWQPVIRELSPSFWCITYDPRGVGRSASFPPTASYAVETHAEDLHHLIIALRSGYVHLVGHGVGAMIAGLCLRRHPQDVRSLSLIAAEADPAAGESLDNRVKQIQSLIILRRLAALPLVRNLVLRRYALELLPPAARKELTHDFSHLNPRAAWQTMGTALEEIVFDEYLSGVSQMAVPVLLVACGRDRITPVHNARKLFARVQRGRLVTLHSCGHFPMLQAPEQLARLLREFFTLTMRG